MDFPIKSIRKFEDGVIHKYDPPDVKRDKRIHRYIAKGQFRDGGYFCKAGIAITEERVGRYEMMCHHIVAKFLPARVLAEAAFDYDDLLNQCRVEVFLALLDGFDPEKAMTSTHPNLKKRAALEAKKRENPQAALEQAEKNIVYGRLKDYMRRTVWKYHPDQRGGKTTSIESVLEGVNQEYSNGLFTMPNEDPDTADAVMEDARILIETAQEKGLTKAQRKFFNWPLERRNALIERCASDVFRSKLAFLGKEPEKEERKPRAKEKPEVLGQQLEIRFKESVR